MKTLPSLIESGIAELKEMLPELSCDCGSQIIARGVQHYPACQSLKDYSTIDAFLTFFATKAHNAAIESALACFPTDVACEALEEARVKLSALKV